MDLCTEGLPDAAKIAACPPDPGALLAALAGADAPMRAAIALALGVQRAASAVDALVRLLAEADLPGRAAAWALGQLDAAAAILAVIPGGKLDTRQHAYLALAYLAARGAAPADLAARVGACLDDEIARAKAGRTGLGEHACRVLAILGAPDTGARCTAVLEADPYTDKFELQRLLRAVADGGRDEASRRDLAGPWTTQFAADLAVPAAPAAAPPPAGAPAASRSAPTTMADDLTDAEGVGPHGDDDPPAAATPIDWRAFLASPQAAALDPALQRLAAQLGPMLEQLAAQAVRVPLAELTPEEFVAIMLQVLPQAMPPQSLQVALSPQAVNAYQAMAKYLAATGHGDGLLQGVKLLREQLTASMRSRGILGGPEYRDPDALAGA
jgi:hypothetical protein